MTIRSRFNKLGGAKGHQAQRSRSPGPPDNSATEPEDVVIAQSDDDSQTLQHAAALPSSNPLPAGEHTPRCPEDGGDSAQTDSVVINTEGRYSDKPQPALGDGRTAGSMEPLDWNVDVMDHANENVPTTTATEHTTSDPQTTTASSAKKTGTAALKLVLEITREVSEVSQILGPLKAATGGVLKVWDRYEASGDVREDFNRTAKKMEAVNDVLKKYGARSDMKGPIQSLADVMVLVRHQIVRKDHRPRIRLMADVPNDAKDVASAIRMLGDVADLFVMNLTASMDAKLDALLENQLLDKLRFVSAALYKARSSSGCLEGTCVQLLAELLYWATTEDDVPPVCFLNGPAGFGKSTVAYTMCKILQGLGGVRRQLLLLS